ncbi:hypothetical protein C8J56DRAFT_788364, partial [Mycena floridula]
ADATARLICTTCLGSFRHLFSKCNSPKLHNGDPARCQRDKNGKLVGPRGPVCLDWQRGICESRSRDENHECSSCGSRSHGATRCHLAQKD